MSFKFNFARSIQFAKMARNLIEIMVVEDDLTKELLVRNTPLLLIDEGPNLASIKNYPGANLFKKSDGSRGFPTVAHVIRGLALMGRELKVDEASLLALLRGKVTAGKIQAALAAADGIVFALSCDEGKAAYEKQNEATREGDAAESQLDTVADTLKKRKDSRPRNLQELKRLRRKIDKAKGTQKEAIRDHVEEECPNLDTELKINRKIKSLERQLSRYKELLK